MHKFLYFVECAQTHTRREEVWQYTLIRKKERTIDIMLKLNVANICSKIQIKLASNKSNNKFCLN